MNKTEAAEIIATGIRVFYRQSRTADQYAQLVSGLTSMTRTVFAQEISVCVHQFPQGTPKHKAGLARPSDSTILTALRKMGEL
jgi:hypothetical protein